MGNEKPLDKYDLKGGKNGDPKQKKDTTTQKGCLEKDTKHS
jgi:hypothetical protein